MCTKFSTNFSRSPSTNFTTKHTVLEYFSILQLTLLKFGFAIHGIVHEVLQPWLNLVQKFDTCTSRDIERTKVAELDSWSGTVSCGTRNPAPTKVGKVLG